MLRKSDLLWLLGYPAYQLIGTLRHEAGHALAAVMQGAEILEFVWWPTVTERMGFSWGYVRWHGDTDWLTTAAPYFVDLITYVLFFLLCTRVRFKWHWLWVNTFVIGLVSPLVNSVYNYWGGFRSMNDVGKLLRDLPDWPVHGYFVLTIALYCLGLIVLMHPWPAHRIIRQENN
ncbi:MAG: hypothetical protein JXB30_14780 [Anaerolineae bacterium]|nr:hypothetical protein [Anaerolineae bacterium]